MITSVAPLLLLSVRLRLLLHSLSSLEEDLVSGKCDIGVAIVAVVCGIVVVVKLSLLLVKP